MTPLDPLQVRTYGDASTTVLVVHGGPGAPGGMAPVARMLAERWRVLEPFQRGSGGEPLTVARHVEDLRALIAERCPGERPALVGHSWGAMLCLAFAAEHPRLAGPLVLVGCGTFDLASREQLAATRVQRTGGEEFGELERLEREVEDPDERLAALGRLFTSIDAFELESDAVEVESCDMRAHQETWSDALRLQESRAHPAAFERIESPVLLLHGDHDPHPLEGVRDSLARHVSQLETFTLKRCGHTPWLERHAADMFRVALEVWLGKHL